MLTPAKTSKIVGSRQIAVLGATASYVANFGLSTSDLFAFLRLNKNGDRRKVLRYQQHVFKYHNKSKESCHNVGFKPEAKNLLPIMKIIRRCGNFTIY